jgi:hypothetical protein
MPKIEIFDNADQIGPDWGFNAGCASGHASATGIRHGAPSRRRRSTADNGDLPDATYDHLLRLTDSTGMLQHATFTIPNYRHGYCRDAVQRQAAIITKDEDFAERCLYSRDQPVIVWLFAFYNDMWRIADISSNYGAAPR